jgi:spoIIIJ-associated protein
MRALQFVVMSALKNNNYEICRVNVDVADYKKNRAERVAKEAEEWVAKVKDSGEAMELKPMNAADRRTVHQVVADAGLITESVGEARDRHIVIKPAAEKPSE